MNKSNFNLFFFICEKHHYESLFWHQAINEYLVNPMLSSFYIQLSAVSFYPLGCSTETNGKKMRGSFVSKVLSLFKIL